MRLHAAMMTQNEMSDLVANVSLLLPYVDSVTIVDGGSIDGTIPYMRNWSREEAKLRYFLHPWKDNFPAQRNNYVSRVREIAADGDWMIAVDPDEFIDPAALMNLHSLAAQATQNGYARVGIRCRTVSLRGTKRVHENLDAYWKGLFFRWHPALEYSHDGEGAVHERLLHADPVWNTEFVYEHRKQENVTWPRGVRNYFCGGGGPNLGSKNHRWMELKAITGRLGIFSWQQMHSYLLAGQIDQGLKNWIIQYRHENGWDGSSEQREFFKTYYRLYHPEEEPAELQGEQIP